MKKSNKYDKEGKEEGRRVSIKKKLDRLQPILSRALNTYFRIDNRPSTR